MAKKKTVKKPVVIKPNDTKPPCPQGYYRNSQGVCVLDVG